MKNSPAEEMRWCGLGCGAEFVARGEPGEPCPSCGKAPSAPYGWRYRNTRGTFEYASSFETLPPDVRKETTR